METKSILMVDGYSLIYRAFHALPLLTDSQGRYTNAVHGFFSMLLKALNDFQPAGLCVMMDMHVPTFRHTLYEEYKGTRKPMPEELRPQVPIVREILAAMGIQIIEMEGYEADDLLGTASRIGNEQGYLSYILTGDRDSLQLVGEGTRVVLTRKGLTDSLLLDRDGLISNYGFTPEQVPDMKGLMGDNSDNIPGIPGIGEKTALKLITTYNSLDGVLSHADEITGKLGEKIRAGRESAILSCKLGTICRTVPLTIDLDNLPWRQMAQGIPVLEKYGLNSLSRSVGALLSGKKADDSVHRETGASKRAGASGTAVAAGIMQTESESDLPYVNPPERILQITNDESLAAILEELKDCEWVCLNAGDNNVTLRTSDGCLLIVPIPVDLLSTGLYPEQLWPHLYPLLSKKTLIVHNAKALWHKLSSFIPEPLPIAFDVMLAAYLIHTALKDYHLPTVWQQEYGVLPENEPDAQSVYALWLRLQKRLEIRGMNRLFYEVEQPLTRVLFDMEQTGFAVNRQTLLDLGKEFTAELDVLRDTIYNLCGVGVFNLNSPRQLGDVLFEKLGLPSPAKKGKTGYSTTAEILESLSDEHPVIEPILRYRKLQKLMSTYVDGLLPLIEKDGRVRSTFDQTATVTGRISSLEPNLQNIPIRTEEGRKLREAFIATDNYVLLDADYSQIELRVLAHLSGDEAMSDAFIRGQDIHTRTAAEIQGVPMERVTPEMRRAAKATNFGIVYGISAFGLSKNAHISRKDADRFIRTYFERYPQVKQYMDDCVAKGLELGYAETMMGRRRELFELRSPNRNVRSFGERAAMNTPVQGTAADLIKLAMVRVYERLRQEGYRAKLILQVHDELVVECPVEEVEAVAELLRETMQNVAQLKVPLLVDLHSGSTWEEAH